MLADDPLSPIEAKIFMSDMYDIRYGIYNHVQNKHPLSTVLTHDSEDVINNSLTKAVIEKYRIYEIQDLYGLSLLEFLSLPPDMASMILDEGEKFYKEKKAKESKTGSGLPSEFKDIDI